MGAFESNNKIINRKFGEFQFDLHFSLHFMTFFPFQGLEDRMSPAELSLWLRWSPTYLTQALHKVYLHWNLYAIQSCIHAHKLRHWYFREALKKLTIFGHCPKVGGGSEKSQTFYSKFSLDIFQCGRRDFVNMSKLFRIFADVFCPQHGQNAKNPAKISPRWSFFLLISFLVTRWSFLSSARNF